MAVKIFMEIAKIGIKDKMIFFFTDRTGTCAGFGILKEKIYFSPAFAMIPERDMSFLQQKEYPTLFL